MLVSYSYPKKFAGLYNISADSTQPIFIVDKASQMFYVIQSNSPGHITTLDSIQASTGQRRGDKRKEGDKKTPEGVYRLTDKIEGENLPKIYGPLALVLNYPNSIDDLNGYGGSNIWIHGRNEKLEPRQTEGCISLENHSIIEVYKKYVDLENTYIAIFDTLKRYSKKKYNHNLDNWTQWINTWSKDWEEGDFSKYEEYYSPNFHQSKNLKEYIKSKKKIDRQTSWKKIEPSQIAVLSTDYEAKIKFNQKYITPKFYSLGMKTLTLQKNNQNWNIIQEDFKPIQKSHNWQTKVKKFAFRWIKNVEQSSNLKNFYLDTIPKYPPSNIKWFQQYKNIKHNLGNFNFGLENNKLYTNFNFTSITDNNLLSGSTKLYLNRQRTGWKIKSDSLINNSAKEIQEYGRTFASQWADSWESGHLDQYLTNYSKNNFTSYNLSYTDFAERKKRIERLYSWIDVEIREIQATRKNDNLKIIFRQKYRCPKFFSTGTKSLLLSPNKALEWKIIEEDFSREKRQNIRDSLEQFIHNWKNSWANQKIDKYINYYDKNFETSDFTRQGWYQDKKEKFEQAKTISIDIGTLKIESDQKFIWKVSFNQEYKSDVYQDYGTKQLTIQGQPGNFKIINEEWWQ